MFSRNGQGLSSKPSISRNLKGIGGVYSVPKNLEKGSQASGQFYIANVGGTAAHIREIVCETYIATSLPMKRPYEGKEGSREEKTLLPGESTFYLFGRTEPLSNSEADSVYFTAEGAKFYVLGWIGYTDDLDIYKITHFCRRFDQESSAFVPVDNPDYENEN